jgi:ion channel
MLEATFALAAVALAAILTLLTCVLLQYEGLLLIWRFLAKHGGHRRIKVLYGIGSVIVLHVAEICIFGVVLSLLLQWPACGALAGQKLLGFFDYLYFSAVTFSTVGFGDLAPVGPIRLFAATEALAGFVLITWSASFAYLEMERFWRIDDLDERK